MEPPAPPPFKAVVMVLVLPLVARLMLPVPAEPLPATSATLPPAACPLVVMLTLLTPEITLILELLAEPADVAARRTLPPVVPVPVPPLVLMLPPSAILPPAVVPPKAAAVMLPPLPLVALAAAFMLPTFMVPPVEPLPSARRVMLLLLVVRFR